MLVSIKLLFAMLDHVDSDHGGDDQRTVRDDQRTSPTVPDVRGTVHRTGRDDHRSSGTVPDQRTAGRAAPATDRAARPAGAPPNPGAPGAVGARDRAWQPAPTDVRTVAHLVPAARVARATLAREGRSLSRDNLADAMRDDGNGVSNARASLLVKILKAEQNVTSIVAAPAPDDGDGLVPLSEVVA